jgi:hypothetical protein
LAEFMEPSNFMTPIPLGLVGAGRSRGGLGPFLATFLERAGCTVTAVAGRSEERAVENAAELGQRLGHAVRPCPNLEHLCASGIAGLVIASPPRHHLAALQASVSAKLPVLCEKPLVHEEQQADGYLVVKAFGRAGIFLTENCQWPFVLPALRELYAGLPAGTAHEVALGLAPNKLGRKMVQNSLSHILSVAQAVGAVDAETEVTDVSLDFPSLRSKSNVLRFRLRGPRIDLAASLYLDYYPSAPRPAWVAVNGARMDRRIGPGYTFSFIGNGREVSVPDPVEQLVQRFAKLVRRPDVDWIDAEREVVLQRLRLYGEVLSQLP